MNKVVDWQLINGCGMHAKEKAVLPEGIEKMFFSTLFSSTELMVD